LDDLELNKTSASAARGLEGYRGISKIFALGKTGGHDTDGLAELVLSGIADGGQVAAE
jgi:hypothetical protein